jgi:hypothetical protein
VLLLILLASLAAVVRPSSFALFLGTFLFIIVSLRSSKRRNAMALAGAAMVLAWGATPLAQLLIHGSANTTSPVARGLLQHTLYCTPSGTPGDADALFVEQSARPVRRYIETAPPDLQSYLRLAYSTVLRFALIIPVLGRRHDASVRSEVDPHLSRIAFERLRANPSCYAKSVLREYFWMAIFASDPTDDAARRLNAFIDAHPLEVAQYPRLAGEERMRLRASEETEVEYPAPRPSPQELEINGKGPLFLILPFRVIFGGAALLGLLSIAALFFRKRLAPQLRQILPAMAAIGLALHSMLGVTAIVELGFWRYFVPFWPLVCTLVAVAGMGLSEIVRSRRSKSVPA